MLRALIPCAVLAATVLLAPVAARADDPAPAEADTLAVSAIGQTSATFRAIVVTHGLPTKVRFEYGTTEELTQATPDVDATDTATVTVPVTGLTPGAHYFVAARAENADGDEYGSVVEFDTTRAPTLTLAPVTDLGPLSATLHVKVAGYGLPVTLTTAVRTGETTIPSGGPVTVSTDGDVAMPVTGLQPSTSYHWTATAASAGGSVTVRAGGFFQTPAPAPAPRPAIAATTAVYGSQITLSGAIPAPFGVSVALQRQVFPFTTPYAAVAGAAGTTDASGRYAFTVLALVSARYGVLAPGYTIRDRGSSVAVRILPAVTTRVTRVKHRRFVVSGRYLPSAPAEVTLFRIGHGAVIMPVQVRRSGTTGRAFRFAVRALKPGRYEVRVVPSASSGLARTHSTAFTIPRR